MEEKKEKQGLNNELDENVKKVSITGLGDDETVVMKQELDEEDLDEATGGASTSRPQGQNNQITGGSCDRCLEYSNPCRPVYEVF